MSQNKITLTPEQADEFGRELDAIRERVMADLGERDADYIRRVIKAQRALEVGGRALLFGALAAVLAGGHRDAGPVEDPRQHGDRPQHHARPVRLDARPGDLRPRFEWDTACPADQWRHSHNYMHHTYTNIVGMDRDIGYGILRMSEDQRWRPYFLGNPSTRSC